jgi:hypothetical protein
MLRPKQEMNKKETINYLKENLPDSWNYETRYNDFQGRWEIYPKRATGGINRQ